MSGRRVLLLINSLEGGGAENVMARLAGGLAAAHPDWQLRLALLDDLPAAHDVDPGVAVVRLDARGSMRRSVVQARRLVRDWRPEAVLSFLTRANCAAVLACRGTGARCVISERVNTTTHLGGGPRAAALRLVVRGLYPRADRVIAVSSGVAAELARRYGVPQTRLQVINNPVDHAALRRAAAEAPDITLPPRFLVSVGRLAPNKGQATLLRAFAAARAAEPPLHLVILGEGVERPALQALAADLGIADRVHLPGYVANPHAVAARAAAFVSASRSEGFPNAQVEAMALGLPVLCTDCESGPSEILADAPAGGVRELTEAAGGFLAPVGSVEALAAGIARLSDPATAERLGRAAAARAARYGVAEVLARYAEALAPGR